MRQGPSVLLHRTLSAVHLPPPSTWGQGGAELGDQSWGRHRHALPLMDFLPVSPFRSLSAHSTAIPLLSPSPSDLRGGRAPGIRPPPHSTPETQPPPGCSPRAAAPQAACSGHRGLPAPSAAVLTPSSRCRSPGGPSGGLRSSTPTHLQEATEGTSFNRAFN